MNDTDATPILSEWDDTEDAEINDIINERIGEKVPAELTQFLSTTYYTKKKRYYHPVIAASYLLSTYDDYMLTKNECDDAIAFIASYYEQIYGAKYSDVEWAFAMHAQRDGIFSHHFFNQNQQNQLMPWYHIRRYKKFTNFANMAIDILDTNFC